MTESRPRTAALQRVASACLLLAVAVTGGSSSAAAASPWAGNGATSALTAIQPPQEQTEVPLTAAGAVLWDPAEDLVVYGRREAEPRPPASTTKIMTVLLALEAGSIDEVTTVSARAAGLGGASLGLAAGQRIPVRSLLAGLLLRSGNDAALAVAEHVAGSEAAFVEKMNTRAAELGLTGTFFVNASGLTDDPRHVASPLDLARLAHVAMQHPDFAAWAGATRLTVEGLGTIESRNVLLETYPGATGVKTGFLARAGSTLVGSAEQDGWTLYAVVLGSSNSFTDAAILLDYGFGSFRRVRPLVDGAVAGMYRWAAGETQLVARGNLAATVPAGSSVSWRSVLDLSIRPPLAAETLVGEALLVVDGEAVRSIPLHTEHAVGAGNVRSSAEAVGAALQDVLRMAAQVQRIDRSLGPADPAATHSGP